MRSGTRSVAGGVLAAVVLIGCTATGAPSGAPPQTTPTARPDAASTSASPADASPPAAPTPAADPCLTLARSLPLRSQAGQLVMVGVSGGLDATERRAITDLRLGSVILMGGTTGGVKGVNRLTSQLEGLGGETGMLVATDQEGGLVQRLKGPGFSTIPSAARQAKLSDQTLRRDAARWGAQLARAGVRLNLAPVADVVPAGNRSANRPIASLDRGYGSDPVKVGALVAAFRAGMRDAGVETAVKHFPGLGAVSGNTDFSAVVVDRTTTASSRLLIPFRNAVVDGGAVVMVSSAVYRRIDPDRMAAFSPEVIGILRSWDPDVVVLSDDLGVAAALRSVPVKQRAVRFVGAGGDLAITVAPAAASAMVSGLVQRAKVEPEFAQRVAESAGRVLTLKAAAGAITCT